MTLCCIKGCRSKTGRDKLSFFGVPSVITRECEKTLYLSRRRRALWIQRINRTELQDKDVKIHTKVCSKHFINGRPSKLFQEDDPDWAPSLHLVPSETGNRSKKPRKKGRPKVVTKIIEEVDPLSLASVELRPPNDDDDDIVYDVMQRPECIPFHYHPPTHSFQISVGCQTDIALSELDHLYTNYSRVIRDNIALRADVERLRSHIEDCPISKQERLGTEASHLKLYRIE